MRQLKHNYYAYPTSPYTHKVTLYDCRDLGSGCVQSALRPHRGQSLHVGGV